jgi:hypothetical protein
MQLLHGRKFLTGFVWKFDLGSFETDFLVIYALIYFYCYVFSIILNKKKGTEGVKNSKNNNNGKNCLPAVSGIRTTASQIASLSFFSFSLFVLYIQPFICLCIKTTFVILRL